MSARFARVAGSMIVMVACSVVDADPSVNTAFVYQGHLKQGGASVDGLANFEFGLWDLPEGGVLVVGPISMPGVLISRGLFSVQLDFGAEAFRYGRRWLQIAVETGAAPLTVLSPRQEVMPAPLALGLPGLSIEQTGGTPSIIGGYVGNSTGGAVGATISGGGAPDDMQDGRCSGDFNLLCAGDGDCEPEFGTCTADPGVGRCTLDPAVLCDSADDCAPDQGTCEQRSMENRVAGDYGTVGGGLGNLAGVWTTASLKNSATESTSTGAYAAIAGGYLNEATEWCTAVAGGYANKAKGYASKVAGGYQNEAAAKYASVGGGYKNKIADLQLQLAEHAVVAGGKLNEISGGSGATISGGIQNMVKKPCAVIGGGELNEAHAKYSAIVGGYKNKVQLGMNQQEAQFAAVLAGKQNEIAGAQSAAIVGGEENRAAGPVSAIGGGYQNEASGAAAAIPGGSRNRAQGDSSMAVGRRAKADHHGTFVWADHGTDADFASTAPGQFLVRAPGGVGIGTRAPMGALHVRGGSVVEWSGGPVEGYGKTSVYTNQSTLDANGDFAETIPSTYYRPWLGDNYFFRLEVFVSLDPESGFPHTNRGSGYSMALIAKQRGNGLVRFNEVMTDAVDASITFTYSSPQAEQLRVSVNTNKAASTPYRVMIKISH
ncbi:MAG: hypothetical protein AMXMBFR13_38300 [Phycisphaerae bacterium]